VVLDLGRHADDHSWLPFTASLSCG